MRIPQETYGYSEYAAIAALPENVGRLLELLDGEIIAKDGSFIPSLIAGQVTFAFNIYLRSNPIGYVTGADGGYILDDRNVALPDAAYIARTRLAEIPVAEVPGAPDLAVEVKSPNDSVRELQRKARKYLSYGTQIVWIFYPDDQTVDVCLPDPSEPDGMRIREVSRDGVLEAGDLLPGFRLALKDVFATS